MDNQYSHNEFLAFALLYASHVDIEYSDAEKEKVKSLINQETYDRVYNDFITMSDYSALQTILSYKELYYPTDTQKEQLLNQLKDLFMSDGDFSVMEEELLLFLDKLM